MPAWLVTILARGAVQGALAGLVAITFVMLWRTTRVVNLAQPSLGLVGGTVVGLLVVQAGWSFWWAAPIGLVIGALLGVLADRSILVRLQDVPRSVLLIATIGLAQVFDALRIALPFAFGGELPTYALDLGFTWDVFPVRLLSGHLLALVALPVATLGTALFLNRSRIGVAAQALGQDTERARSLGIPAATVRTVVAAVAGAIAGLAGTLSIPVLSFGLGTSLAPTVLLLALAPAVFAGLRSIWGAAVGSILLGMAYVGASVITTGGLADVFLGITVLVAVAVQRERLGRSESATRASAWEAATTTRPLPWSVSRSGRVYAAGMALVIVAVIAAALPPLLLSPSMRVSYGTGAAVALAAVGVGIAWMFAGELPLGHWGFAGLGAALGAVTPGPWGFRALIAGAAIGIANAIAGLATRRRSGLSFAVVGLAAAAAAPVALLEVGRGVIPADTGIAGATGGVLAVLAVLATIKLRATTFGARLVAARDDPERAKWLGIDPVRSRVMALGISGFVVGVAGVLFVASLGPAGIAEGSFAINRSLALLAMAVVGGISSPPGVLLGAALLIAAERILPRPWNGLTSGVGVLAVVIFLPAGLARVVERIRDAFVRVLVPPRTPPARASRPDDERVPA